MRVLRRAVGDAPNSPDAHNYYGFALARSGNLTESVAQFEVALKSKPDHAGALYNLGCAFIAQSQPESAIGRLRAAVAARPEFPEAHAALAMALSSTGEPFEAIRELRTAFAAAGNGFGA